MSPIENNNILLMRKTLDATWQKLGVTAENIAHADTPGYKAKYVTFQDELKKNMDSAASMTTGSKRENLRKSISESRITVHTSRDESVRLDGNNVNADMEQIELARAQLEYSALVKQLNDQFSRLKMVIEGR